MSDKKRLGQHFENLSEDAKTYIESEIAYHKLDFYKKLIKATSLLLKFLVNSTLLILAFSFLFVGLSLLLGYIIGYYFIGFLIISGFLFIVTTLMVIFGKPFFESRVLKIFNSIFSDLS
jgi:hypothetical protein